MKRPTIDKVEADLVGKDRAPESTFGCLPALEGVVAHADLADDTASLQVAHRRHLLADRNERVRLVDLVEVDLGDPEAAGTACGTAGDDRLHGQQRKELRGDERLLTPAGDRTARRCARIDQSRKPRPCRSS